MSGGAYVAPEGAVCLERGRLGDGSHQRHDSGLQISLANAHPSLVHAFAGAKLGHKIAQLGPLGLDFVHQVDFGLRQVAIALDMLVLVIHAVYLT